MSDPLPLEPGPPRKKSRARHLWVVGLLVYVLAIWFVGWQKLRDALAGLDVYLLLAVVGVELTGQWLRALKWRFALGRGSRAIGLFFLSRCAGYWMPMRMGELSPLLLKGHRTPRMGAWIVLDRILEVSVTLALGALGIIALGIPARGIAVAMGIVALAFVVVPMFLLTRRKLFLWLAARTREGSLIQRGALFLAAIRDEMVAMRPKMPAAAAMTLAAGCLDVCVGMLTYASFGHPLRFAVMAGAKCVHAIACAVPFTPNATGVPFFTSGLFLNQVGAVPASVIAAAIGVNLALVNTVFWTSAGLASLDLRRR
ncbi:MAG: flippase-like domain-containing protein [Candidatus Hydrogenedentes bacterium]|nr:flippase-like domain-containing protein [Candidatus Hydrogenedentota bacterium]